MNDYTSEQQRLIFDAVRYYQMNAIGPLSTDRYTKCDEILNRLFPIVRQYNATRPDCDI